MRKMAPVLFAILASCTGLRPDPAYVTADRATFDTVAPVVQLLADTDLANDPDLSGVNGESLLLTISTWELRLKAAEKGQ